jgi:hypothetical protein
LSFAAEAAAQGTWLPGYNHPDQNGPIDPSVWGPTFKAINMAMIPNSNNVIVWDHNHHNQMLGPAFPWPQRFSVGNPEVPASWSNHT